MDGGNKVTPCDISDLGLRNAVILREGGPVHCRAKAGQTSFLAVSPGLGGGVGRAYLTHLLPDVVALGILVLMGVSTGH